MNGAFTSTEPIYTHTKRDQWGYAIRAFERDDRRAYLFQDGRLRVFKKGYYDLMQPAAAGADETQRIVEGLKSMLKNTRAMRAELRAQRGDDSTVTFDAIVGLFREVRPEGFEGEEYQKTVRGRDAKRRLKRHVDPAVADAREKLSREALDALLERGDGRAIRDLLHEVLDGTGFVTSKQLAPLAEVTDLEAFATALRELLHGDSPVEARFERWVKTLPREASWELTTAPGALVRPEDQLFVKASAWTRLIARAAPQVAFSRKPTGYLYGRLVGVAEQLVRELRDAKVPPADFFDVHHLVCLMTRADLQKRLAAEG